MKLESLEIVIYTGMFLVPGYIMNEIISTLMPIKREGENAKFLKFIGYSIFNFTLWIWAFWLLVKNINSTRTLYWVIFVLLILVTSIFSGTVIGLIRKLEIIRKIAKYFNVQIEHPIPTAWDYKFSKTKNNCWIVIALTDGKFVRGIYGGKSLSSTDAEYRDIYLEEVYLIDDAGNWKRRERTEGIWINSTQIKYIEFLAWEDK